jgi:hypothetical protein
MFRVVAYYQITGSGMVNQSSGVLAQDEQMDYGLPSYEQSESSEEVLASFNCK